MGDHPRPYARLIPSPWRVLLAKFITYGLLSFWAFVCVFPLYWFAVTSIKSIVDIDGPPTYVPFVDFTPSLDAWRFILADPYENLLTRFANSLVVAIASTLLALVTGGMAIYGLTRFQRAMRWPSMALVCLATGFATGAVVASAVELKWLFVLGTAMSIVLAIGLRRFGPNIASLGIMTLILATRILPPIVLVLPLYVMAQATGTRDTLGALVFVYTAVNLPVAIWLLHPILGPRAIDQEESAQLDGASHLTIFFTILLPMVRIGLFAVGLLIFLLCWNEYLFAAYLTFDHALTLPPWMVGQLSLKEAQVAGEAEEWANLSAATIVMVVPVLFFAATAQRLLSRSVVSWR